MTMPATCFVNASECHAYRLSASRQQAELLERLFPEGEQSPG